MFYSYTQTEGASHVDCIVVIVHDKMAKGLKKKSIEVKSSPVSICY